MNQLRNHGFAFYAPMSWSPERLEMTIGQPENPSIGEARFAIYAFVIGDRVVRIGKYQGPVRARIRHRAKIITKFFTPAHPAHSMLSREEPGRWRAWFEANGNVGEVWAQQGVAIEPHLPQPLPASAMASARARLTAVEAALKSLYRPPINMEMRRQDWLPAACA